MDSFGWKVKTWKIDESQKRKEWILENLRKYQIREIFVNNALAVEYKLLLHI